MRGHYRRIAALCDSVRLRAEPQRHLVPRQAAVRRGRRATVDKAHALIVRDERGAAQEQDLRFAESFCLRDELNQQRAADSLVLEARRDRQGKITRISIVRSAGGRCPAL